MEKLTVNSNKVDVVRRFRMYKDGKKWIVAGTSVLAFGLAFGINGAQVSADQVASDAVNPDAGAQNSDATTTITQGALTSDTPAVSDTSVDTETSATADTTKTPTDSAIPDAGTQTGDDAKVIASATSSSNAPVATDASMNTETTTPVYTPAVSTGSSAVKPEAQNVSLASNVGSLSAGSSVATSDANAQFTYTPDGTNSYYGKSTPSEDINALNSMFTTGTNNSSTGNLDPAVTVDGRPNAATPLTDGGDADDNSDGNQATTKLVDGEDQTGVQYTTAQIDMTSTWDMSGAIKNSAHIGTDLIPGNAGIVIVGDFVGFTLTPTEPGVVGNGGRFLTISNEYDDKKGEFKPNTGGIANAVAWGVDFYSNNELGDWMDSSVTYKNIFGYWVQKSSQYASFRETDAKGNLLPVTAADMAQEIGMLKSGNGYNGNEYKISWVPGTVNADGTITGTLKVVIQTNDGNTSQSEKLAYLTFEKQVTVQQAMTLNLVATNGDKPNIMMTQNEMTMYQYVNTVNIKQATNTVQVNYGHSADYELPVSKSMAPSTITANIGEKVTVATDSAAIGTPGLNEVGFVLPDAPQGWHLVGLDSQSLTVSTTPAGMDNPNSMAFNYAPDVQQVVVTTSAAGEYPVANVAPKTTTIDGYSDQKMNLGAITDASVASKDYTYEVVYTSADGQKQTFATIAEALEALRFDDNTNTGDTDLAMQTLTIVYTGKIPYQPSINTATIDGTTGDVTIKGVGNHDAVVTIYDKDGNSLGATQVTADDTYEVVVPGSAGLKAGDTIVASESNPQTGVVSPATTTTVGAEVPTTTITSAIQSKDGSIKISGTVSSADGGTFEVVTWDKDGNQYKTTVNSDGTYTVNIPAGNGLMEGDSIKVTAKNVKTGMSSAVTQARVTSNYNVIAPVVDDVKMADDGSVVVKGTADYPGDTITIKDKEGNVIGTGVAGDDKTFTVTIPAGSVDYGDMIYTDASVPATGKHSDAVASVVDADKPTVASNVTATENQDGSVVISGEAAAGDEFAVIRDKNGAIIGTGVVGDDGKFEVKVPAGDYKPGEDLNVTIKSPNTGMVSDDQVVTITADKPAMVGNFGANAQPDGSVVAKGEADVGNTVTVSDGKGHAYDVVADAEGLWTVTFPATDGVVSGDNLQATQKNPNTDLVSDTKDAKVNISRPDMVTDVASKQQVDGSVIVTGKAKPGESVAVAITSEDGTVETRHDVTADEDGNWTVTFTKDEQVQIGDNIYTAVHDTQNDLYSDVYTDVVVPVAPTATAKINENGTTTVTGKAVPGSMVVVEAQDGTKKSAFADVNGDYTIDLPAGVSSNDDLKVTANKTGSDKKEHVSGVTIAQPQPAKPAVDATTDEDGNVTVVGKGEAGNSIIITDNQGNNVATGTVQPDGSFEITIPSTDVKTGDELNIVSKNPNTDLESDPADVAVKPEKPSNVVANGNQDGSVIVSGQGTPGSDITITDKNGNETTGKADNNGKFEVTIPSGVKDGDKLTVVTKAGDNESQATDVTVSVDKPSTPTVNAKQNQDGSVTVSGKGDAGNIITITDVDGNKKTTVVDGNGHYTANITVKPNADVTVTAKNDETGLVSDKVIATVVEADKPGQPIGYGKQGQDGQVTVSGQGTPGDKIIIKDAQGNVIGETVANIKNGNFSVKVPGDAGDKMTVVDHNEETGLDSRPSAEFVVSGADKPAAPTANAKQNQDGSTIVSGHGAPGDAITITDKDGNKLGEVTVDENGNYSVDVDAKGGDKLTVVDTNPKTDVASNPVKVPVADADKPANTTLDNEAKQNQDGSTTVTGEGKPGDNIVITDKNGNKIGETIVGGDGRYTVEVPAKGGDTIEVVVKKPNNDQSSESADVVVAPADKPADVTNSTATGHEDGSVTVDGQGTPGNKVTIIDKNGNELATGSIDNNGNFEVTISSDKGVKVGDNVTVIVTNPNTDRSSDGSTVTVGADYEKTEVGAAVSVNADDYYDNTKKPETPTANGKQNQDGATTVEGQGTPGDAIVVKDQDGKTIGETVVDPDGNYSVDIPAKGGDTITVVEQNDKGISSDPVKVVITPADNPIKAGNVSANENSQGEKVVSGDGTPGDHVVITDKNGNVVGTGDVDENGHFTITIPDDKGVAPGDEISIIMTNPKTGEVSEAVIVTVVGESQSDMESRASSVETKTVQNAQVTKQSVGESIAAVGGIILGTNKKSGNLELPNTGVDQKVSFVQTLVGWLSFLFIIGFFLLKRSKREEK